MTLTSPQQSAKPCSPQPVVPVEGVLVDHAAALGGIELLRANYRRRVSLRHTHLELEVGIVTAGRRLVDRGNRQYVATAGSILVFAPGELHCGRPVDESGSEYAAFLIPLDSLGIYQCSEGEEEGEGPLRFDSAVVRDASLSHKLVELHAALVSNPADVTLGVPLLALVRELLGKYASAPDRGSLDIDVRHGVSLAKAHVDLHYSSSIRLETLAELSGLGMFQLIRAFRSAIGLTPYAYVEQLRIQRAKQLLRAGMKASLVAHETGFSDQSHLTRHLKRVLGVPPARYQRRALATAAE